MTAVELQVAFQTINDSPSTGKKCFFIPRQAPGEATRTTPPQNALTVCDTLNRQFQVTLTAEIIHVSQK